MSIKQKTIFIGMSGGVDSSVSAHLLKEAGYEVIGVFIKVWQPEGFLCTAREDRLDAMRVAAQLDIPFITLDLEKEYKEGVIDYMLDEYKAGNTPNPDVMCNREVKFGAFLRWALSHGADYIATGHYAQVIHDTDSSRIINSIDTEKDQTYFLWTLIQSQIQYVLFPIGHMPKSEVRKIAEKQNLYTSPKKDSQGLCFVGDISFKELLKMELSPVAGNVLDESGNIIGTHEGAILYTKGERHGFTITAKSPNDEKLFVVSRDVEKNTITVSPNKPELTEHMKIHDVKLDTVSCTREAFVVGVKYKAKFRYRAELFDCVIKSIDAACMVITTTDAVVVTPGQSAVLYTEKGAELAGGGIIRS